MPDITKPREHLAALSETKVEPDGGYSAVYIKAINGSVSIFEDSFGSADPDKSVWMSPSQFEKIMDAYRSSCHPSHETNLRGTESPWKWWAGSSEEWCTIGPKGSREEIIQAATNDSLGETDGDGSWKLVFHIVEARQDDLRLADWIESDRLLERAEDSMADSDRTSREYDDGPWFECSPEHEKDLDERIKRACDEWQAANGLKFSCPTFSHTRNNEVVVVDLAIEALAKGTAEGQP